jgi:hypothetical protein
MRLAESEDRSPLWTVGVLCALRYEGKHSDEEIARKLGFDSVEDMRSKLQIWQMPSWLVGEESETNRTKKKAREKSARRPRNLGPAKGLPPAGNATPLFKERLEALLESAELLKHMDEDLYGKYFVRTNVETAPVFYPRERYSKEEWDKLCEQYDLDPDDKGFWDTNVLIRLPGGAALSPSEIEATLISVYALAGGQMDLLLDALHPDSLPVKAETQEGIRKCVEGSKADGDPRDGLKVLAQHLATWVRGSEVGPGRPPSLSEVDHAFACRITHHRKHGLTYEEIARKESHRKKEDGTSYSVKDITELGDLGLSWS